MALILSGNVDELGSLKSLARKTKNVVKKAAAPTVAIVTAPVKVVTQPTKTLRQAKNLSIQTAKVATSKEGLAVLTAASMVIPGAQVLTPGLLAATTYRSTGSSLINAGKKLLPSSPVSPPAPTGLAPTVATPSYGAAQSGSGSNTILLAGGLAVVVGFFILSRR